MQVKAGLHAVNARLGALHSAAGVHKLQLCPVLPASHNVVGRLPAPGADLTHGAGRG